MGEVLKMGTFIKCSNDELKEKVTVHMVLNDMYNIPKPKSGNYNSPFRPDSNSKCFGIGREGQSWEDFVTGEKGDIFTLVMKMEGCEFGEAKDKLKKFFNVGQELSFKYLNIPKKSSYEYRIDFLEREGYKLIKTYDYKNIDGTILHTTLRFEKEGFKKEFVQKYESESRETILYNLDRWHDKDDVCIVGGEKDSDTLTNMGFNATTNSSGENKWEDEYNKSLRGKNIVIFEDNDKSGRRRTTMLLWSLKEYAKSFKIIRFKDYPEKTDVTDYIETGKTRDDILQLIEQAEFVDKDKILKDSGEWELRQKAKKANQFDIENFEINSIDDKKKSFTALHLDVITENIFERFCNFPRRVGNDLFDHNHDTGEVEFIRTTEDFISWMERTSKRRCLFMNSTPKNLGMKSPKVIMNNILSRAIRYDTISKVPHYKKLDGVFYSHGLLPEPSAGHVFFERLVHFFNPVSEYDEIMIRCLLTSPLFQGNKVLNPIWVIDSESPASGKSTLAEITSLLYDTSGNCQGKIEVSPKIINDKLEEFKRRLITGEGRKIKVVVIDNITGVFKSPNFSALTTSAAISETAKYDKNESVRKNDLTYIITSNNAIVNHDIAIRAYFIRLKKIIQYSSKKISDMYSFIETNRMQILSDLIDIINTNNLKIDKTRTRSSYFEKMVLLAHCEDLEQYKMVMDELEEIKKNNNSEHEEGAQIEEILKEKMLAQEVNPENVSCWIRTEVLETWLKYSNIFDKMKGSVIQNVRNLASSGHCDFLKVGKNRRWPFSNKKKPRSGIAWISGDKNIEFAFARREDYIIKLDENENFYYGI